MKCHEELKSRECRLRTDLPHLLLVAGGLAQRGEDELAPLHDLVRDAVEQRVVVGDGAGIERRAARRDLVRAELLVVREVHRIEEVYDVRTAFFRSGLDCGGTTADETETVVAHSAG